MAHTRNGLATEFAPDLLPQQKPANIFAPPSARLVWSQPDKAVVPASKASLQMRQQFAQVDAARAIIAQHAIAYEEDGTPQMTFIAASKLGLI